MGEINEVEFKRATEMQKASAELERNLPDIIDSIKHTAKIRRASYEAHIAEGFTPVQALELSKKITL